MTITAQPNQSMLDLIIQCMGTLEGGMCFCALNNVGISDTPVVGTVYEVPDGSASSPQGSASSPQALIAFDADTMVDSGVLQYLGQNGIVVGNLGTGYAEALEDNDGDMLEDNDGEGLFDNG